MSSLKADFDELRERIRQGRDLGPASFEPVFYLVFPPEQILEVTIHQDQAHTLDALNIKKPSLDPQMSLL